MSTRQEPVIQIHSYPTRFAANNLAVVIFNKMYIQRSIRYTGRKFWNEMLKKIKNSFYHSHNAFVYSVKQYLKGDLNLFL